MSLEELGVVLERLALGETIVDVLARLGDVLQRLDLVLDRNRLNLLQLERVSNK